VFSPQVHIPYEKIGEHLPMLRGKRLNLEIYFGSKVIDGIKASEIENIKRKLDYSPELTVHAPFMDLSPGAVDSKVRAVTLERFYQTLDIAGALGAKAVVFHSGYEKWRFAHRVDIWLEGSLKTWKEVIKRAEDTGVKIAVENIFEDSPGNLALLMKELGSERFGICFDTGHCNLFSKVALEQWLSALKDSIIELHIHDNDRSFDSHLPIGEGTFDFGGLFTALRGRELIYTLENHNPEGIFLSMERLRGFLSDS
jgi:sugar phosphate isomerase/epimerase